MKQALLPVAFIGFLAWSSLASAGTVVVTDDGVQTKTVGYADLNLSSDAGAKVLIARLRYAAATVCGPQPRVGELQQARRYNNCRRQSMGSAVDRVNAPLVTALYSNGSQPRILARK